MVSELLYGVSIMNDIIGLRMDRALWIKFMAKVKQQRKKAADVIEPFLRQYIKGGKK